MTAGITKSKDFAVAGKWKIMFITTGTHVFPQKLPPIQNRVPVCGQAAWFVSQKTILTCYPMLPHAPVGDTHHDDRASACIDD